MDPNKAGNDPFPSLKVGFPCQINNLKTSEEHIASLESKLAKLKGKDRAPTSKAMIESMSRVRETHMGLMVGGNSVDYVSSYLPCSEEGETTPSFLDKKLHPERVAVNSDELKLLIDNDELSKVFTPENADSLTELTTNSESPDGDL